MFSDWEISGVNSASISLDTVNTIVGVSALKFSLPTSASGIVIPKIASLKPFGLTKGSFRMLVKPVTIGTNFKIGVVAMHSSRTVSGTSGYFAYVTTTEAAIAQHGSITSLTVLGTVPFSSLVVGTTISMEFQWISDVSNLGAVDLVLKTGTALDFSDLTERVHVLDSTPLTTSIVEGIAGTTSGASEVRIDQTSLYRIT